jgi:predicted esterase
MVKYFKFSFLLILLSIIATQAQSTYIYPSTPNYSKNPGFTTTDYQSFTYQRYKNNIVSKLPFRILFPLNYNQNSNKVYPVFFMLHGRGEAGTDNNYHLKWGGKMHLDARNRTTNPIDAFVVFPQEPNGNWTNSPNYNFSPTQVTTSLEMTWELADSLIKKYKIDGNRVYIHGLSSGGSGVWASLYHRPDLFAAAQPMSTPGDTSRAPYIANIPIWLHQGGVDTNPIPYISRLMIAALKAAGAIDTTLKYTEYANVGHSCWTLAYAQPDFFPFFLRQSKRKIRVLGNNPFCPGETVTLGFSYNMNSYQWYKDNIPVSGATQPNLEDISANGLYHLKFKRRATSNWENSDTINIYQNSAASKPLVTASGSLFLPSPDANKVVLKGPKGYNQYLWSNSLTTDSVVVSTNSSLTLQVRGAVGCWSLPSDLIIVRVGANDVGTPQIPTNLQAYPRSPSSVLFTWTDNSTTENGFEVYRSLNANGPYKFISNLAANTVSFVDTLLTASTRYYYKVRVYNANGANMSTSFAYTNTYVDLVAPPQPTNLKIASADLVGGLTLTWDAVTDNVAIKEYRVYSNNNLLGTSTTNKVYLNLVQYQYYSFRVVAVDFSNNLSVSSDVLIWKHDGQGLVTKYYEDNWNTLPNFNNILPVNEGLLLYPKMATSTPRFDNLIGKTTAQINALTRVDIVRSGVSDYFGVQIKGFINMSSGKTTFYLSSDDGSKLLVNNQLVVDFDGLHGMNEKSGSITLSTSGWYPIEIQYFEKSGGEGLGLTWQNSNINNNTKGEITTSRLSYFPLGVALTTPSSALSVSTPTSFTPTLLPATVVNATTNKMKIQLTWAQSNVTNIIGYELYRNVSATTSQGAFTKIADLPFILNNYKFVDSVNNGGFLQAGKYYTYKLRAKSANSFGTYVQSASTLIPATINNINLPNTPISLALNPLSNSVINLAWSNNGSNNLSGVEIWRSNSITGIFNLVGKSKMNATSFNDSTCISKTYYCYKIRAFNARGKSSFSTVACTTTLNIPNIPTSLTATAQGESNVALAWTVTDDQALGFKIYRATSFGGTYTKIDSLANPILSTYQDLGLTANTTYFYKVKAYNKNDNGTQNESAFSNIASVTTLSSFKPDTSNWHLPIVAGTFSSTFSNKFGNIPNKRKLGAALENKDDFLNMMQIDSTLGTNVSFSFQMRPATEFPEGAMLIYNLGYSEKITVYQGGGVSYPLQDSTTIVNGEDRMKGVGLVVKVSSSPTFATFDILPNTYYWKSFRNYDLQKIDLPVSFVNGSGATINLGGKYVRVEFTVNAVQTSGPEAIKQSLWLSEVGLYKFSSNKRHNYVLLLGASIEERLPGMGLTTFRKNLAKFPDLKDQGKNLVIFNWSVSGTATGNLQDSIDTYLAKHPKCSYVFVHQGGNNINSNYNNMRPLTFDRLSSTNCVNMVTDFKYFINTIYANNKIPFISRMHFRDYKAGDCSGVIPNAPAVKGGLFQENSSLPVNLLIDSLTKVHMPYIWSETEKRSMLNYYPITLNEQNILGGDGIHPSDKYIDTLSRYWIDYGIRYLYTGSFATPLVYTPANRPGSSSTKIGPAGCVNNYFPMNKPNLLTLTAAAVDLAKKTKSGKDIWDARILVEQLGDKLIRVPYVKSLDSLRDFRSPLNPRDLTVGAIDNTSIILSWLDLNNNETGFEIYRSTNGGSYSLITTLATNSIEFTDINLDAVNEYQYYVRAVNGSFKSGWSNVVKIRPTVTYYLKPTGDFANLSSWGRQSTGLGSNPSNFAGAGQTFVIANRSGFVDLNANLSIDGQYSKVVLPEGQTLRVNNGYSFNTNLELNNNTRFYCLGNNIPNILKADSLSKVVVGTNVTLPNNIPWGSVELLQNNITFSGDTTRILGDLKINGTNLNGGGTNLILKGNAISSDTNFTVSNLKLRLLGDAPILDFKSGSIGLRSFYLKSNSVAVLLNSSKLKVVGSSVGDEFVLSNGSSLDIGSGTISVTGTATLNTSDQSGYFISNGGNFIINYTTAANSNLRFSSNSNYNKIQDLKLQIPTANKLNLKSTMNVKNNIDLKSGVLKTNNYLCLMADFENSSRILKLDANASIEDSVFYQNYIGPFKKQGIFYIATPIKNRKVQEWANSFTIRTNASVSDLKYYDEPTKSWIYMKDLALDLVPGKGYAMYIPQAAFNLDPDYQGVQYYNNGLPMMGNGTSNTSSLGIPVTYGTGGGWNMVSNPYPCELDWNNATGWDKSAVTQSIYFWDSYTRKYAVYDATTQTSTNGAKSLIPSGQSFFVKKKVAGSGFLYVNESAKVATKPDYKFYRLAQTALSKLFINLSNSTSYGDQSAIVLGDDFNPDLDDSDHEKILGEVLNVYTIQSNTNLVLQCLPKTYDKSIPIGITTTASGKYTLSFEDENFLNNVTALTLYDSYLNVTIDLMQFSSYEFDVTSDAATKGNSRFILNYAGFDGVVTNVNDTQLSSKIELFPNPFHKDLNLVIQSNNSSDFELSVIDVTGRQIYAEIFKAQTGVNHFDLGTMVDFERYGKGVYLLKVVQNNSSKTLKIVYN